MPRENRKRGKKHKTKQIELESHENIHERTYHSVNPEDVPGALSQIGNTEASSSPFGSLDPDVKAYFRTVDAQLREWQEEALGTEVDVDADPNEERRMFFTAALSEMNGKELQLATDPDCSSVLQRMLYSMDDFVRRVFTDSLAGSWLLLMTDRFASHVCQTLFALSAGTVGRESRGIFPTAPSSSGKGELLTMTRLIMNTCEDILPELSSLIQDRFASHVLRALLLLLAPAQLSPSLSHKHTPSARSKKSASWKARHGPMKAAILDESRITQSDYGGATRCATLAIPDDFQKMASRILGQIRDAMGGNEVRALAVNKVASPVLQMLLELEAAMGQADLPDSLMDCVLVGLVTESDSIEETPPSSYVSALFLDATSSHLSEAIVSHCPSRVFDRVWERYVVNDLPKLAAHPVANFVVARGVERLNTERLEDAIVRLDATWSKTLKLSRLGILTAMIDRAGQLGAHEAVLVETVCSMFKVTSNEDRTSFVPCVLRLKTISEYQDTLAQRRKDSDARQTQGFRRNTHNQEQDVLEPKIQGSILLQSVIRLHEPHNNIVLESIHSLLPSELLALACNATSSRILDAAFESPTVPLRSRKRLVTSFIGQFHVLVDDRIGSRVADRCWDAADPYLKEKIARSLIPHEQFLAGSHFGRFFTRNLGLPLLQRNPDQWKALRSKERKILTAANATVTIKAPYSPADTVNHSTLNSFKTKVAPKRKRTEAADVDEIDALFSGIGANKRAKGPAVASREEVNVPVSTSTDLDLAVLNAIKTAPGDTRGNEK